MVTIRLVGNSGNTHAPSGSRHDLSGQAPTFHQGSPSEERAANRSGKGFGRQLLHSKFVQRKLPPALRKAKLRQQAAMVQADTNARTDAAPAPDLSIVRSTCRRDSTASSLSGAPQGPDQAAPAPGCFERLKRTLRGDAAQAGTPKGTKRLKAAEDAALDFLRDLPQVHKALKRPAGSSLQWKHFRDALARPPAPSLVTVGHLDRFQTKARDYDKKMAAPDTPTSGKGAETALVRAVTSLDDDTLTAVRLAAADGATADRIIATLTETSAQIHPVAVRRVLDAVVHVAMAQAQARYQHRPFKALAAIGRQASQQQLANPQQVLPGVSLAITRQLHQILRGLQEPGLMHPGETQTNYLHRILSANLGPEEWQQVQALLAPPNPAVADAMLAHIRKSATCTVLALQYEALFKRLSGLLARNALAGTTAPAYKLETQPWPGGPIRCAKPYFPAGALQRAGESAWFWLAHAVRGPEARAQERITYWEGKVDRRLRTLLRTLSRTRDYDTAPKAPATISKQMASLHEALDSLHIQLKKQQSTRNAHAYFVSSLTRRYAELGEESLKNIWVPMLARGWQPPAFPRSRWSRWATSLRIHLHPFRDPAAFAARRAASPAQATRMADTWKAMRTSLHAEVSDQRFGVAMDALARAVRDKRYDDIAAAADELAQCDARRPGDAPLVPAEFGPALQRLDKALFEALMHRLAKYSWSNGRDMVDFLKPTKLDKAILPKDKLFYMGQLLERLYSTALEVQRHPETRNEERLAPVPPPATAMFAIAAGAEASVAIR
jgi:hypothetical protein